MPIAVGKKVTAKSTVLPKKQLKGVVLRDYGRFVLMQMKNYKECFYKEDLKEEGK
jgi:hypothetical protein